MIRRTSKKDLTLAWVYAANASIHEETPGPAELNIGSAIEPHMVSRSEAFRDLYAHLLLEDLHAGPARIDALRSKVLRSRKRSSSAEANAVWDIAAELCERARLIIDEAGAAEDAQARARLLAGTKHLNRSVVLGQFVPQLQRELDAELAQELNAIESE
ncbi:hypothetical protein MA5S0422_3017 [Mycobacteroides abscessus 5S-0422]|uniref:Uncharacterized protein n=1 Tax=Mycobacteroides abscessus subsp. bolletii 1513 TaxID=1299321 RepID=X8DSQ5_9MYCO|nr:hypothetical protein [Mycobacteroides abscessus]EUA71662.1 hypothetical protein I540_3251 [Mycobacteroides abscessus subsp. bolletii 1513]EIU07473.1 hypothetical protein MA5S0421_2338 [Mycobacteroides abscessus 5S-0421]EIU10484.1 hypothetical protein MA5S0304_2084 [Mycobacteroides abscessus 5S-0304]EIU13054.1 hypothetical protein MA5S0422_3017 [Mycobacteroides abscessus 5S-0422]EIU21735.1 hypothetical protein MA5S0708_5106 [Mycobacteroides abscessus 5S-0708]